MSRVAVIGAGIGGLVAALELAELGRHQVSVYEAADRVGGRLGGGPFAGVVDVDTGADAFLARVPDAVDLAERVGLGSELVSPAPVGAAVWFDGLHRIPDGLVLGVPSDLLPLARSGLFSWRGKARAALEPFLPRTSIADDAIGPLIRHRFGDEVHDRLVDALVGSIYATDTDHFSLAEVPQLHALARDHRSLLIGARSQRRRARSTAGTATAGASPVFATPRGGMSALVEAVAAAVAAAGGTIRLGVPAGSIAAGDGRTWLVGDEPADVVVVATPPSVAAGLVRDAGADATGLLSSAESADVVMITLHVPASQWPDRLRGLSGYLVPKPVQQIVTAVSFGSQKWPHWKPPSGGEILRVSVGRDGRPVLHLSDEEILDRVLADLDRHLGVGFEPSEVRITRWPGAFAQYRPHHAAWVERVDAALPSGLFVTGAGYRGIGVPACIRDGIRVAQRADALVTDLAH